MDIPALSAPAKIYIHSRKPELASPDNAPCPGGENNFPPKAEPCQNTAVQAVHSA